MHRKQRLFSNEDPVHKFTWKRWRSTAQETNRHTPNLCVFVRKWTVLFKIEWKKIQFYFVTHTQRERETLFHSRSHFMAFRRHFSTNKKAIYYCVYREQASERSRVHCQNVYDGYYFRVVPHFKLNLFLWAHAIMLYLLTCQQLIHYNIFLNGHFVSLNEFPRALISFGFCFLFCWMFCDRNSIGWVWASQPA